MFNVSYEEIISRIKEEKNLSDEEITAKIKDKLKQLSDLISKEGAAHIVANELGVIITNVKKEVKINKLLTGMNNVIIAGKVLELNEIINYDKNGRKGKVVSFKLGDDTGVVRVVFWDVNHIKEIEEGKIKQDTILKVKNGYVRANNGYKEVHLGNKGELEINPDGIDFEVNNHQEFEFVKKKIVELNEGDTNVGVFGTIVQVFEPRFYEACTTCGRKVELIGDSRQCREHGLVKEELVPVLNISFDDGTDNLRAVAFRKQIETLLGLNKEQILEMKDNIIKFEEIRQDLLGKQIVLIGRITKNQMFDRKEMSIQKVIEVKPEELINELEK